MGLAAANTQVNLLYVVLGLQTAALLLSAVLARRALARQRVRLDMPERAMVGRPFTALVSLETSGSDQGPYLLGVPEHLWNDFARCIERELVTPLAALISEQGKAAEGSTVSVGTVDEASPAADGEAVPTL